MNEQIVAILHKCINGVALTDIEKKALNEWIGRSHYNRSLYDEIMNPESFGKEIKQMLGYNSKGLWKKISHQLHSPKQQNKLISIFRNRSLRYAAAAVLLILISTTAYFMFVNPDADQQPVSGNQHPAAMPDVAPGTEKAVLTLADGTTIVLDSLANGAIAHQGNAVIMKEDGLLAYNANNKNLPTEILYNTITVPRGGEYKSLVLADGTKVWLNSLSSMRFPTAFTGKERIVEITGEAYFEVAKNMAMPFKVTTNGMQVEVLGTHFNVNAYKDEAAIKTTLVEGLVKIINNGRAAFLKPGQQASLNTTGEIKVVDDAGIEEAVAWKNGLFRFQKADIKTIMRQVGRWYDVEVEYEKEVRETFSGTIPRNVTVSKLFTMLELTGRVHFKIDGKKIVVMP